MQPIKFGKAPKTPQQLLDSALLSFEKAKTQVEAAVDAVDLQVNENESKLATLTAQIAVDTTIRDRLQRVRDRVVEFIS